MSSWARDLLAILAFIGTLLVVCDLMQGCGSTNPVPPTGSACTADPQLQESCWTCASEPVCAWWGSNVAEHRGCHARTEVMPHEDVVVVRLSDACNMLPISAAR